MLLNRPPVAGAESSPRADYSGQGGRVRANTLTTSCPKGRSTRAFSEVIGPRLPGRVVLTNRAWQGAASGLAAPDADGARATTTPRLASSRTVRRRRIGSLLAVAGQRFSLPQSPALGELSQAARPCSSRSDLLIPSTQRVAGCTIRRCSPRGRSSGISCPRQRRQRSGGSRAAARPTTRSSPRSHPQRAREDESLSARSPTRWKDRRVALSRGTPRIPKHYRRTRP